MSDDEALVRVTLELPKTLWEELKRTAVADLRPMKDELVVLLREALAGRADERS
jgi:hypothetical protein